MKNLLMLISVFFLLGCGGGSGSSTIATASVESLPAGTEKMIAGQTYQAAPGDQVVKTSEDAQVKVIHVDDETNSTIELVVGEANIVRSQ